MKTNTNVLTSELPNVLINLLTLAVIMILVDAVFLTSVSPIFNKMLTQIQGTPITLELISTTLCYLVLLAGLYYFIIKVGSNDVPGPVRRWSLVRVYLPPKLDTRCTLHKKLKFL